MHVWWPNKVPPYFIKVHIIVSGPFEINELIILPTSKKLTEHIGFGLCVRPSVRNMNAISDEPCMLGF